MLDTIPNGSSFLVVDDILDTGASLKATLDLTQKLKINIIGAFYLLDSCKLSDEIAVPIYSILKRRLFT